MRVVFEFEQIVGRIFEEKCAVFDAGAGEPDAGLLIEGQFFCLGFLQELLPQVFRREYQTEMARINTWLRRQWFRHQMGHELVPREPERDGVVRLPTQRTTKPIDIETFRRRHVVNREGEMEKSFRHCLAYTDYVQFSEPGIS